MSDLGAKHILIVTATVWASFGAGDKAVLFEIVITS